MILTVSLNPSIDKTYLLPGFNPCGINLAERVLAVAGGKANNVARVLRVLGRTVRGTGFVAGHSGAWVEQRLAEEGVETCFLAVPGETRSCLALVDPQSGKVGEVREPGPTITPPDQERLLAALPQVARGCGLAVVSGSLPKGISPEFLAGVVRELRSLGLVVILDATGQALVQGLTARPNLIKPNLDELSLLIGRPVDVATAPEVALAVAQEWGVDVVVSLGEAGAWAVRANGDRLKAVPPQVQAVNTVGAGDSMVAGLAAVLSEEGDLGTALRLGVACGTASVLTLGVASVRLEDVESLLTHIEMGA